MRLGKPFKGGRQRARQSRNGYKEQAKAACPEREVLFIARDGDIPCGTVYLRSEPGVTELYAMWVDPAFRRWHVASALLEAAIS